MRAVESARLYRVVQEETSVFWEVIVSVIFKKKKGSYEHVSNSEWLPRSRCLNLRIQTLCQS